ncbi:hypothetical protein GGU10DRAFT_278466 [Lentinula aff. detonsa]|uniref:FAD-binding domain-containing protein n=1 Tax=Lentinula aff. detonsa TaxID=2804958 RepID=A0AA38NHJ8_9AGAR|nr:hypothetical protein GGU10DRAFT_278466 [Lentinula aff. detonsa]
MPDIPFTSRKASVSARITIIGASITGLATACILRRSGHEVLVVEKSDGKYRTDFTFLRSPPNMTRVLQRWGLQPYLAKSGMIVDQFRFLEGQSGKTIGVLKLYEELLRDLMADFLLIHHGDLISIFQDLAHREGVEIRYNTAVVKIERVPLTALLENGDVLYSDLVVGADGPLRSISRDAVLLRQIEELPTQHVCFSFSVSLEALQADAELEGICAQRNWNMWLGDGFVIYGACHVCSLNRYSLCITTEMEGDMTEYQGNWTKQYPVDHFDLKLERFEPRIRKLLKMAEFIIPTCHVYIPEPENLICDLDKVILAGQSAHPTMPDGMHSTAMCIEDVDALDYLLTRIKHIDEIPRVLSAHEELRMERCTHARDWESRKLKMLTLLQGEDRDMRDAKMRCLSECEDMEEKEYAFNDLWGEEVDFYAYDPIEQADNWWSMYGTVISRRPSNTDYSC